MQGSNLPIENDCKEHFTDRSKQCLELGHVLGKVQQIATELVDLVDHHSIDQVGRSSLRAAGS